MQNARVRQAARAANVPLWKLADALGISEASMTRLLRHKLEPERDQLILDAITALDAGGGEGDGRSE